MISDHDAGGTDDADRDMSDRIRGELARRRQVLADRVFGPADDPDDGPQAA